MSKIPSLFGKVRAEVARRQPEADNVLDSPTGRPEGREPGKLTGEAIKGLLAQKLSRKVMQKMQSEKLQKLEEVLPQFEHHLRQLDAEFQEFMELASEKLEKLDEDKVGKDAFKALERPEKATAVPDLKIDQVVRKELAPWHEEFEQKFEQLDNKIVKLRKDCKIDHVTKLIERAALKTDLDDSLNLVDC